MADSCQRIFFQMPIMQAFYKIPSSPAVNSSQPHLIDSPHPRWIMPSTWTNCRLAESLLIL